MRLSRIITGLALPPAIVFWIMIVDYARGGHGSDQMIKAGIAGTAICIAFPVACLGMVLTALDRHRDQSRFLRTVALCANVLVIASPLIYLL